SVPGAVLTQGDDLVGELDMRPVSSLGEVDLGRCADVAALHRPAAAEAAPESALEPAATEERLEDVRHRAEALEVRRIAARAQTLVAVAVVGRAAVGVGQDLVGLRRLLELLLRTRVVAVDVRVQHARQAAEGLLDLSVAGIAG